MDTNKERRILVLWVTLTVLHVKFLPASTSWNWFEAQELCAQHNDSLPKRYIIDSMTEGSHIYWAHLYRRYSFWIKILGCYRDISSNDETHSFQMYVTSAGFCQEMCATVNSSIFGIKEEECKCFKRLPDDNHISQTNCNLIETGNVEIKFAEYGGDDAYTLYESDFNVAGRYAHKSCCVAVDCHSEKRFLFPSDCRSLYHAVCQNWVSEHTQTWSSSMNVCKNEKSTYLAGNISLNDIEQTCNSLNITSPDPSWIGVAKEVYFGSDRGLPIHNEERGSFLACAICNDYGCGDFVDCTVIRVDAVHCEKGFSVIDPEPVTTGNKARTTQSVTQTLERSTFASETPIEAMTSISTISTVFHTNQQDETNSSNTLAIIFPLVAITIFIGCFAVAAVFYIRRKRGQENHNAKPLDSKRTENGYTDIDVDVKNKNYFVLEQQSKTNYNESPVNYTYDSNPYTDIAEGVYDHLRDKKSRKRREDDGNLKDSNPYKHIAEGIYDHLKDKESGKINKGDGKVMDSNPYKETEGGVYDHLREKENGKFTEENNYDHTPATTGKEYCAHGGMDEHTADTDYDHAMSFYNYKQHDQVIEETDGGYAKTVNVS